MYKRVVASNLIFIFLCLLLSSCSSAAAPTLEPLEDQTPLLVQEVSASAEVVPLRWVTLSYPSGAENIELLVSEGDEVEENQVLVTSTDNRMQVNLYQAQAALQRAQFAYDQTEKSPSEAALAAAQAAVANAKANLQRQKDIFARDIVIEAAEADLDAAEVNLESIEAGASSEEIDAAAYDLEAAELALKAAEDAFVIRAPFPGTVVEVLVKFGEAVTAFQPVLTLADLSNLRVKTTDLSEVDITKLSEGGTASIYFDALSNQTFTGTIERIADRSSGVTSVYYEVTLILDQVPEGLRWGMTAFVIFPVE